MKCKKVFLLMILIVGVTACILKLNLVSYAIADNWYNNYTYTLDDENDVIILTKYNGTELNVEVPATLKIAENNYNVVISGNVYSGNNSIKSITFLDGVIADSDLSKLFYNCVNLEIINFNKFNTEKVISIENMFAFCRKLKSLDLSMFNTSNVNNMRRMFADCSNLNLLNISNFDTSELVNMEGMFYGISKLEELDLSSFDTKKVANMMDVFNGVISLKKITLGPKTGLKTSTLDTAGNFGRGSWKKLSDGKIFFVVELGIASSSGATGTYIKESTISSELDIDFPVTYKIEKISKISKLVASDDSGFYQEGNRVYAKIPLSKTSIYEVPGSAEVLFEDVVSDANNNKYNLSLKISNIKLYDLITYGSLSNVKIEIVSVIGNGISFVHSFIDQNTNSVIYAILNNNGNTQIFSVKNWLDFSEGEQLQLNFYDNTGVLTSFVNTSLVSSKTSEIVEIIADAFSGSLQQEKSYSKKLD